jgi:chorismate-pyruvate lyase
MNPQLGPMPDLETLVGLFYDNPARLGRFEEVNSDELPEPYSSLLDHDEHMTVTVESFHGSRVDVQVLATNISPRRYARKILLPRQTDGGVVQFGIVRLNLRYLDEAVRREIQGQGKPLGRILIEHEVLREVELVSLWRVACGPDLQKYFSLPAGAVTYGRTALIHCNGEPAVELLEIVAPA